MKNHFIQKTSKVTLKEVVTWFGTTSNSQFTFEMEDYRRLLHNASNVIFIEGIANGKQRFQKALNIAIDEAASLAKGFNFLGGRKYLFQIRTNEEDPLRMEELEVFNTFTKKLAEGVEFGYTVNQLETTHFVRIKITAVDLPEIS